MAIYASGMEWRKLSQPIYSNGERVLFAHQDGKLVYPDDGRAYLTVTGSSAEHCDISFYHDGQGENVVVTTRVSISYTVSLAITKLADEVSFTQVPGKGVVIVKGTSKAEIVYSSVLLGLEPINDGNGITVTDFYGVFFGTVGTYVAMDILPSIAIGNYVHGPDDIPISSLFSVSASNTVGPVWPRRWPTTELASTYGVGCSGTLIMNDTGDWTNTDGTKDSVKLSDGEMLIAGVQGNFTEGFDERCVDIVVFGESKVYYRIRTKSFSCRTPIQTARLEG